MSWCKAVHASLLFLLCKPFRGSDDLPLLRRPEECKVFPSDRTYELSTLVYSSGTGFQALCAIACSAAPHALALQDVPSPITGPHAGPLSVEPPRELSTI
ncbi:hypothetical protein IE81DRAFT_324369 [Ceraceosorus guamensis]|uniref:Secreted protein n=1 Tax=Ceraceosorus guamensis TaxID=1522189 RepID=A0A316W1T0_9BASI|nr:hypothetical protein IE81DRAFT_324369 [Ceraceosorus guamensis]PWN41625.1 hypothetical protein IE81DRAFT_324369 [Ceraceosorus guamensis]